MSEQPPRFERRWPTLLFACAWLQLAACAPQHTAEAIPAAPPPAAPSTLADPGGRLVAPARPGLSRPPNAGESQLIEELVRETERIRALRFKQPVDVRIQDRIAMRAYVSRAIEQEDLVRGRRRYVALGLLDPALDVRDLLESLMEEELVGYYDPKERLLAVRDDVARSLNRHSSNNDLEWRATVVHELVHALQDQHLGLGAAMDVTRTTDGDNAFGALVEGDATLAMLGYVVGKTGLSLSQLVQDHGQLEATLGASPDRVTGALKAAPAIVREPLLFRYRTGAVFAASLFQRGGWSEVDRAHRAPPTSSLSVIEPSHFIEPATSHLIPLVLPDLSWLSVHGFRLVDEDTLGGLEFGVALESPDVRTVQALTRAWRGDRFAVLEPTKPAPPGAAEPQSDASVWCIMFVGEKEARQAQRQLERMPDAGNLGRRTVRLGTGVVVTRGLPSAAVDELVRRLGGPLP